MLPWQHGTAREPEQLAAEMSLHFTPVYDVHTKPPVRVQAGRVGQDVLSALNKYSRNKPALRDVHLRGLRKDLHVL